MAKVRLTADGLAMLQGELEELIHVRRQELADRIRQAREEAHGDSGDSTAYDDAKTELAMLELRIAELEHTLAEVEIIEVTGDHSEVSLGAHVIIQDTEGEREEYVIVDHLEADPRKGRLSQTSPVGKVLMGKREGEEVIAETPAGDRRLTIVEIR